MSYLALLFGVLGPVAVFWWSERRFERLEMALTRPHQDSVDLAPIESRLTEHAATINGSVESIRDLEEKIREQNLAIAEGIERVDRAERRVRESVRRAQKRMADLGYVDEGIEAEAAGLRAIDEADGADAGVPPLQQDVGSPGAPDMSAFPGRWD